MNRRIVNKLDNFTVDYLTDISIKHIKSLRLDEDLLENFRKKYMI